jgi:hypothetical protein
MSEFPAKVALFIDQQIESLAQLEALLLLRTQPDRKWIVDELAKSLYITSEMADLLLADLIRRGWADTSTDAGGTYRYRSQGPETDSMVDELAAIYAERRVAVISRIYSKPLNKVQTFADAFRLRREDPQ